MKISAHEKTVFVYDGGAQLVAEYTAFLAGDPAPAPQVSYLTQDHLGSTRVITNNLGQVIKRSDYMAYGDEVITANRSSASGYEQPSETRKGYTGYERDIESGLDFAQARYYNPNHGRFTSVDPLTASANVKDPQTFNRYTYALNSPYKFTDPLGLISSSTGACGQWCQGSGEFVDGKAFSGKDASIQAIFAEMDLNRARDAALETLESDSFDERYADNVSLSERLVIKANLTAGVNSRDPESAAIATALVNSNITIEVRDRANITKQGSAEMGVRDAAGLNKAIAEKGTLSRERALGFLYIAIAREELSNPVSSAAAVQANLIHEGVHAISHAEVISSISSGKKKTYINVNNRIDEIRASRISTKHLLASGGELTNFGIGLGFIKNGKVDEEIMRKKATNVTGNVQDRLKGFSVIW